MFVISEEQINKTNYKTKMFLTIQIFLTTIQIFLTTILIILIVFSMVFYHKTEIKYSKNDILNILNKIKSKPSAQQGLSSIDISEENLDKKSDTEFNEEIINDSEYDYVSDPELLFILYDLLLILKEDQDINLLYHIDSVIMKNSNKPKDIMELLDSETMRIKAEENNRMNRFMPLIEYLEKQIENDESLYENIDIKGQELIELIDKQIKSGKFHLKYFYPLAREVRNILEKRRSQYIELLLINYRLKKKLGVIN